MTSCPQSFRVLILLGALGAGFLGTSLLLADENRVFLALTIAIFFASSLAHAWWRLGPLRALTFLALALSVSLCAELVGVATGSVFGPYYYTDRLGWMLCGLVPLLVPPVWFIVTYVSHALAASLVDADRAGLRQAVIASLAATVWDLTLDPVMVARGCWVWPEGGSYYGVPAWNFAGWLATALTIYLLYGLFEHCFLPAGKGRQKEMAAELSVGAYAVCGLVAIGVSLGDGQCGAALFGSVTMGSFIVTGAICASRAVGCAERQGAALAIFPGDIGLGWQAEPSRPQPSRI